MNKATRYAPEVRERAVRLGFEHQGEHESQWAAIGSIASKIGCTAETLRNDRHRPAQWDPYLYLRHVLERIAEHPINRVDQLLPWHVALAEPPSGA